MPDLSRRPSGNAMRQRIDDTEKRWHDPGAFRAAAGYTAGVLVVAFGLLAALLLTVGRHVGPCGHTLCETSNRYLVTAAPAVILVLGALYTFFHTYRVWRRGGTWPMWQGAGWFLLVITLVYMGMSTELLGKQ